MADDDDTPTLRYILKFQIEKVEFKKPTKTLLKSVFFVSSANKKIFGSENDTYIKKAMAKKKFLEGTFEENEEYYVILHQTHIDNLCEESKASTIDDNFTLVKIKSKEDFLYTKEQPKGETTETTEEKSISDVLYTDVTKDNQLSIESSYVAKTNTEIFKVSGEKIQTEQAGGKPKGGRTKRRKYRKKRKSMSKSSRKSRRKTAKK